MIASLTGRVCSLSIDSAVIEVGGVGLSVLVTPSTRSALTLGMQVTLHTTLVVREESLTLFGFTDSAERDLFEVLQTATGVGPKLAQAMLSVHSPDALRNALLSEDLRALESVPGIGRKGAQRIVLELKDRVGTHVSTPTGAGPSSGWRDQVSEALVGLGFSAREASEALEIAGREVLPGADVDVAALLRLALRSRGRG